MGLNRELREVIRKYCLGEKREGMERKQKQ